jgi:hypothetical protein
VAGGRFANPNPFPTRYHFDSEITDAHVSTP